MNTQVKKLLDDALGLSESDRVQLAMLLFDSVDAAAEQQRQEEWEAELERRSMELETGAVKAVPWSEVRRKLWEGIGGHAAD